MTRRESVLQSHEAQLCADSVVLTVDQQDFEGYRLLQEQGHITGHSGPLLRLHLNSFKHF